MKGNPRTDSAITVLKLSHHSSMSGFEKLTLAPMEVFSMRISLLEWWLSKQNLVFCAWIS